MERNNLGYIYRISFPSGKVYIGYATDPNKRLKEHLRDASKCKYGVQRAFCKYKSYSFDVIYVGFDQSHTLEVMEPLFISEYRKSHGVYNMTSGGDGVSGLSGDAAVAWKENLSKAHTGKKLSSDHKAKISEGLLAIRDKISEKSKEQWDSLEYRIKASGQRAGRRHTKEHVEKTRVTLKKRGLTDEHKEKIQKGLKEQRFYKTGLWRLYEYGDLVYIGSRDGLLDLIQEVFPDASHRQLLRKVNEGEIDVKIGSLVPLNGYSLYYDRLIHLDSRPHRMKDYYRMVAKNNRSGLNEQ